VFGLDGYLYLGLGDGGSAGDPQNNAQSLTTLLGKILRLDVDGGDPYAIPPSNPFADGGGLPEIWAFGLRNPWRFHFDRQNGDLYIGDVGQNLWEEIDYLRAESKAERNFGWKYYEGTHPYEGTPPADFTFIAPIYEYGHDQGCSVTGGVVYRGQRLPEWDGIYLFGDYCAGWVDGLRQLSDGTWQTQRLFGNLGRIASFGEDEQGEVYVIDHGGTLYRLEQR
jgi:glucose/arabinose dehydrogenase